MPKETPDSLEITDLDGIGPSLAERIKKTLEVDSIDELLSFSHEELAQVKGIGSSKAQNIYDQLQGIADTCERCESKFIGKEACPDCKEELLDELELVQDEVESLDPDIEVKGDLEEDLQKIRSGMDELGLVDSFDLLQDTKEVLEEVEEPEEAEEADEPEELEEAVEEPAEEPEELEEAEEPEEAEEEFTKITNLDGVGSTFADRIKETLDVKSLEELATFSKEQLTQVEGIGSGKAEKIYDQLEKYAERCDRCGKRYSGEEICPYCIEDFREELDVIEENLVSLKKDVDTEGKWNLDKRIDEIESDLAEGDFESAREILDFVKDDLAAAEQLYGVIYDIEKLLDEEGDLINRHTYEYAMDSMLRSLRHGNYHRAGKKAKKIKEHIEKEEKYHDIETDRLRQVNIEEFSSNIMGIGLRDGEKIYGAGFHTLEKVYKAGEEGLEEAGIDERTAERLIGILDNVFHEIDIEKGVYEGGKVEEEEEGESKEDIVFEEDEMFEEIGTESAELEAEEPEIEGPETEELEPEPGEIEQPEEEVEEEPEEEVEEEPAEPVPSTEELFGEDIAQIEENEVDIKYWIPAILIPILLAIVGYILFFM